MRECVDELEFLRFKIELYIGCDNATSNVDSNIKKKDEFSYIVLNL